MSLEDLSAQDRQKLNLGTLVATMIRDPNLSRDTKKLLKKADPTLSFPELDTEDQLEQIRKQSKEESESLRAELARRDAREALQEEATKITEAGLDPAVVRKYMAENGIINVDIVIELFQARQQLAEPSSEGMVGPLRDPNVSKDEVAQMWKVGPSAWRQQKAAEIINKEFRGPRFGNRG
jgi:hypothetical protein